MEPRVDDHVPRQREVQILFEDTASEYRIAFLQRIVDGQAAAAYEGHSVTYSHAGESDPLDVSAMNDRLHDAAQDMLDALRTD